MRHKNLNLQIEPIRLNVNDLGDQGMDCIVCNQTGYLGEPIFKIEPVRDLVVIEICEAVMVEI